MVEKVIHITSEYEDRLRRCQDVPRMSFVRRMLRDDGAPNRFFLMYLFCDESMAIQYLKDIGLLRSKMQCNTCGRDMTWLGLVLFFLITYHHSLFSIHSSCRLIPIILIILRLDLVLFFFNNLSPPASFLIQIHSSCRFIPTILIIVRLDLVLFFFNNLSPLALFHSFLVQIHSYNTHHPMVLFFLITYHHPLHSSYKFIPRADSFLQYSSS